MNPNDTMTLELTRSCGWMSVAEFPWNTEKDYSLSAVHKPLNAMGISKCLALSCSHSCFGSFSRTSGHQHHWVKSNSAFAFPIWTALGRVVLLAVT